MSEKNADVWINIAILIVMVILTWVAGNIPSLDLYTSKAISLLPAIILAVIAVIRESSKTPKERAALILGRRVHKNPVALTILIFVEIQLWSLVVSIWGSIAFGIFSRFIGLQETPISAAMATHAYVFTPVELIGDFFIIRAAAHYFRSKSFLWAASSVLILYIFNLLAVYKFGSSWGASGTLSELYKSTILYYFPLMILAGVACWSAMTTQREFIVNKLFKELSEKDKNAIAQMVIESPSIRN